jgi:hypothetical protein
LFIGVEGEVEVVEKVLDAAAATRFDPETGVAGELAVERHEGFEHISTAGAGSDSGCILEKEGELRTGHAGNFEC